MPTILVTGANGQLGQEMQVIAASYPEYSFLFVTRNELPIDDFSAVKNFFSQHAIDYCVNCAAYTAVDKAEAEVDKAYSINADAVGNLAKICKTSGTQLIHISTDYVFDGTNTEPIKEDQTTNPIGVYGASKLKGEQEALQHDPSAIIIRTSWVYSSFGNNFVKTMLRLMKERESINVVSDQFGCPTYAADLAEAIMKIITSNSQPPTSNIYNYSNKGMINWHQFAVAIKELSGSACVVNPIPSSQYPTPAKRPAYSVMDTSKIQQTFAITIPEWKESLKKCLAKML
ncbi:dTDP-4-dehydrorhamnose reductase [Ferruginibacter lapsinanis]|uniref:dTDP-4-dehydrorhamnose reductase n=1 Tax=Ferruginibacter lapsinanis TaxID=563172 RepID=UPI001E2A1951|nr:dTDP-4-dehydrorhamnose reductase [Ferruginibacter lapsinanis]UEG48485.1 dTDP-4-dehydrorhamnose reductase [Ferruginibacter lapsinanis]